jgi:hypothetical protein
VLGICHRVGVGAMFDEIKKMARDALLLKNGRFQYETTCVSGT